MKQVKWYSVSYRAFLHTARVWSRNHTGDLPQDEISFISDKLKDKFPELKKARLVGSGEDHNRFTIDLLFEHPEYKKVHENQIPTVNVYTLEKEEKECVKKSTAQNAEQKKHIGIKQDLKGMI